MVILWISMAMLCYSRNHFEHDRHQLLPLHIVHGDFGASVNLHIISKNVEPFEIVSWEMKCLDVS